MCLCYDPMHIQLWVLTPGEGENHIYSRNRHHYEFSILEHMFLGSKDLSLLEFISESNMSYFFMYLYALNKVDSKEVQRPISQKSGKD